MGKTASTITQQLNEIEAMLAPFRRALRKTDRPVLDDLFAAAHCHITAIGEVETLLPFQIALLTMLLELAKEVAIQKQKLEQLRPHEST